MKPHTQKKIAFGLFTGLFILLQVFAAAAQTAQTGAPARATIGVISDADFVPDRVQPQRGARIGMPEVLAGRIIEHLTNSNRFVLVDREALRRVVLEQRFGKALQKTYLDRTLDKAIDAMEKVEGGLAVVTPDAASPVGRARIGGGAVGTTGTLSDYNDLIKNFQDLGTTLGADYLVLGNLEKMARSSKERAVPYSTSGRKVRTNMVDARLRLRVIDVKKGTVAGAASIRTQLAETLFEGRDSDSDTFTMYDHLGQLAAAKILDITFPARIVSLQPLLISRGSNDGVKAGDRYLVQREGQEVRDANGLVIARLKSDIGRVEVVTPQATISIVRPVSGNAFQNGDLAVLEDATTKATPVATAATVPLTRPQNGSRVPGKLPRVAIGLVKSGSTARTGIDAQQHVPLFTDSIISRLGQTKRFQLIDRQEVDQLLQEQQAQAMAENRDMPSAMGTLKGADYLVYGNLASFSIEQSSARLPGSSRNVIRRIGHVSGNMRIVDARSGDVIESRRISVQETLDPAMPEQRAIDQLANAYADQVVLMLMNAIYPIKVAHVSADGTIYINRGEDGGLHVGEVLQAFRPGAAIIDPDSGVQLGTEEQRIGRVEVTEAEEARSKGVLIEGANIARGDLLKRTLGNRGKRADTIAQAAAPARTGGVLGGQPAAGKAAGKSTIAVGLLRVTPGARTSRLTAGGIKQLTDELILKLHDSNRFQVMERQEVDQVLDEKAFEAISAGGDMGQRLRQLVGADYLIHGEIINFYIETQRKRVPFLDEVQTTAVGTAEGIFRLVDVHTGAVNGGTKVLVRQNYKQADDMNLLFNDLRDRFTTQAVAKIVARLYPVKVMGTGADGTVYLNRGQDAGLRQGARFKVMRPGQTLIDPDTGRSFGSAETQVATIEIESVEPNRSRAILISGAAPRSGDLLREAPPAKKKVEPEINQPAW